MTGLTFDDEFVDDLLAGRKTATVRYDLDEDISAGDRIELRSDLRLREDEAFGVGVVEDVVQTTIGDALQVIEDRGHEHNAGDKWELLANLCDYYDGPLSLESEVGVVLFEDIGERRFLELERNDLDEVGLQATQKLSEETQYAAASFVVRGGLGPLFLNAAGPNGDNSLDPTPEEIGALLSVSFDPKTDPIHSAVYEWVVEEEGGVVLSPEEVREIADLLEGLEETVAAEFSTGGDTLDDVNGVEWAQELRRVGSDEG